MKGNGDVVYLAQVEMRKDIAKQMKRRAKYLRNRRNRKTRYRKARWANRKNSARENGISSPLVSKIELHRKEIAFVTSILPITRLILETATFDPHARKNP